MMDGLFTVRQGALGVTCPWSLGQGQDSTSMGNLSHLFAL